MSTTQATCIRSAVMGAAMATTLLTSSPAKADSMNFIGEMMVTAINFCPRGWVNANGAILSISQHTALFSLVGTTYGGNGQSTFAVPDLRSRAPIHNGQGPGLSNYILGQSSGAELTTLGSNSLPTHTHNVQATNVPGDKGGPGDKILAATGEESKLYFEGTPNRVMAQNMITVTGGNQAVGILKPYIAMTTCIATEGIFPSRD